MFIPMNSGTFAPSAGAGSFDLTAGISGANEGYQGPDSPFTGGEYGSVTDDTSPGGGEITFCFWDDAQGEHRIGVEPTGETLTNININGSDYSLIYISEAVGNDIWEFSAGTQVLFNGNTYLCEVS